MTEQFAEDQFDIIERGLNMMLSDDTEIKGLETYYGSDEE